MISHRQFLVVLFAFITACAPAVAETVLVKVNHQTSEVIPRGNQFVLDLTDFFQVYPVPGPVVSFEFEAPVVDEYRDLFTGRQWNRQSGAYLYDENGYSLTEDTTPQNLITYKTLSGEPYNHLFSQKPQDLQKKTYPVKYQLFPADAPQNVANFLGYVKRGDYEGAIIHRTEGERWRTGGGNFRLLQTGNLRRYRGDRTDIFVPFELIRPRTTVALEAKRSHVAGSLGIARSQNPNSASSQFFINTSDNSGFFDNFYTVIGELIETDSLSALDDLTKARHHDMSDWNDAMASAPLFTPYLFEPVSYQAFSNFTVSEGSAEGISFRWEFIELEGEESDSEEETEDIWNRDSFEISISEDGRLHVNRIDSGEAGIRIIATDSQSREAEFELILYGFNPDLIDTVGDVTSVAPGENYASTWFGNFSDRQYPFIDHESLGPVFIYRISDNRHVLYHHDLGWLDTLTSRFPWFYAHQFETWLYTPRTTTPETQWFFKPAQRVAEAQENEEQAEQLPGEWVWLSDGELIPYSQ